MRVDHSNPGVHRSEETVVKKNERPSSAAAAKDVRGGERPEIAATDEHGAAGAKAEISSRARDFSNAKAIAAETPDVRESRVDDLKKRIQDGSYKMDSQAIAERMVDDHLKTRFR